MESCWTRSRRKIRSAGALVIGYGNPLRGDDGVGPFVASRLGGTVVHQLTPELAERLAAADIAFFIDARQDLPAGAVETKPLDGGDVMTHSCSPGYLLQLARDVYGRAAKGVLVGIGAESFDWGAPLSDSALRGARKAAVEIGNQIAPNKCNG